MVFVVDIKDLELRYFCNGFDVPYKVKEGGELNIRPVLVKNYPYYEIWEIEKLDVKTIETACMFEDIMFCYSNGEHRGTPYDLVNINGVQIIGWLEGSKDDTFNCLIDYFRDCLGVIDSYEICAYSTYLAKTNGYTLAELWEKLQ